MQTNLEEHLLSLSLSEESPQENGFTFAVAVNRAAKLGLLPSAAPAPQREAALPPHSLSLLSSCGTQFGPMPSERVENALVDGLGAAAPQTAVSAADELEAAVSALLVYELLHVSPSPQPRAAEGDHVASPSSAGVVVRCPEMLSLAAPPAAGGSPSTPGAGGNSAVAADCAPIATPPREGAEKANAACSAAAEQTWGLPLLAGFEERAATAAAAEEVPLLLPNATTEAPQLKALEDESACGAHSAACDAIAQPERSREEGNGTAPLMEIPVGEPPAPALAAAGGAGGPAAPPSLLRAMSAMSLLIEKVDSKHVSRRRHHGGGLSATPNRAMGSKVLSEGADGDELASSSPMAGL